MLAILLAAASAAVWGTADYAGGRATRRFDAIAVAVASKLLSLPALVAYLLLLPAALRPASLLWGAAAGMIGLVALVAFYRGLAKGAMAVVAPVSAVTAAVVPLAVGLAAGELPGRAPLIGAACAVLAIGLVSLAPTDGAVRVSTGLITLSVGSGIGFGLFFVLLHRANATAGGDAGLWPVAASQAGALVIGGLLLAASRGRPIGPMLRERRLLPLIVAAGVLDLTANVLYLLATRGTLLSIVGPLSALYPVSTVLLALSLDRERVQPVQMAGLGLAVAALVLVAS